MQSNANDFFRQLC